MSLHHLGISHFPILHRQFSSPSNSRFSSPQTTSTRSINLLSQDPSPSPEVKAGQLQQHNSEVDIDDDITQDNKDVLIERLNDLILRLSRNEEVVDNIAINAIHYKVDEIEVLMRREGMGTPRKEVKEDGLGRDEHDRYTDADVFWGLASPTRSLRKSFPKEIYVPGPSSAREGKEMSTEKAMDIAREAEELADKLGRTVRELRDRKVESDHIHDLMVDQIQKANRNILSLEYRLSEMEDNSSDTQSELTFLRIQLQAIEAQCSPFIPRCPDKELSESITKWKLDWEDMDRRLRARKKGTNGSVSGSVDVGNLDTSTAMDSSSVRNAVGLG